MFHGGIPSSFDLPFRGEILAEFTFEEFVNPGVFAVIVDFRRLDVMQHVLLSSNVLWV